MPIITVASIEVKPKRSIVTTTDGRQLGIFAEKLHLVATGGTYDVELYEKELNGTKYVSISKAKLVTSPAAALATSTTTAAQPSAPYRQTSELDAERMFVCANLSAAIKGGQVKFNKEELWAATNLLRSLWRHTFGPSGQLHATISQRAMIERDITRDTPPKRAYKDSGIPIDEMPAWDRNENPAAGLVAAE